MKLAEISFGADSSIRLAKTHPATSIPGVFRPATEPGSAPQELKEFVRKNNLGSAPVTITIPRTDVSVKYITLPSEQDNEIQSMVDYEVANLFPLKNEELVYDHAVVGLDAAGYSRVMLVAAPRDAVRNACHLVQDAGLVPQKVSISTLKLFNGFIRGRTLPAHYLLVAVEPTALEILFIKANSLAFTRAVAVRPRSDIDEQILEALTATVTVLNDLDNRIDVVVVSGTHPDLPALADSIGKTLGFPVEIEEGIDSGTTGGDAGRLDINLLPPDMHTQQAKKARKRELLYLAILVGVNLVFLVNVMYVRLKVKREYLKWLTTEIARIEQPASDLRKKALSVQLLETYRVSGKRTLALLSEVYRTAPAGITLNALDISHKKAGGTMTLSGQAQDPDSVLKFSDALKKSGLISGTDVHYIKKQRSPGQEQKVDFELIATFGT